MSARLLLALIALSACGPLLAAGPDSPAPAEAPPAAEAPAAEPAADTPAEPDSSPAPAAAEPAFEIPDTRPPKPRARKMEGTQLLFLRLTLRIKMVEQELLEMSPDRLLEHMQAATDVLEQLRSQRLDDNEIARADRAEEYLQHLTELYVQLRTGKPVKNPKRLKR